MEFIQRVIHALTQVHPTHPMFVHFPIALTGAAFFFILLAYWRKSAALEQTAFANIALASVSTIVAGITGYLDNIKNYVGDAPNANVKIYSCYYLVHSYCWHQHRPLSQPRSVPKIQSLFIHGILWHLFRHCTCIGISGRRHSIRFLGEIKICFQ